MNNYQFYMKSIAGGSLLYNGSEYTGSYPGVQGFPFFESDNFETGYISYNHVLYRDILIAYDLVNNDLVIKGFQGLNVKLNNERVDSFYLKGHLFVNQFSEN